VSVSGSRRFLFVLPDAGGNVPPTLALARRLVGRGHKIRVLGHTCLRRRFEAAGCAFAPFRRAPDNDTSSPETDLVKDWEVSANPIASFTRMRDRLAFGPALAFAEDVLEELGGRATDAVVVDVMLPGAVLGAERAGLPTAVLCHTIYILPAPGIPPVGLGLRPARGPLGRARDRAISAAGLRLMSTGLVPLNRAREALGLPPQAGVFDQVLGVDRVLVLTSRGFDLPARSLPPSVRYVGPQLDDEDCQGAPWDPPWPPGSPDPLVLVSLSSTFQNQGGTVAAAIAALGTMAVRGLVTLGPTLDPADFPAPANVAVRPFVPHAAVLDQARAVVTHGGHGTVIKALAHGVPLVCLPFGRDQADVARRVTEAGAGLRLSRRASPERIGAAVARVLTEARFRRAAAGLAEAIAAEAAGDPAVAEMEALAGA
jgi:MGT family glycosyltransferase